MKPPNKHIRKFRCKSEIHDNFLKFGKYFIISVSYALDINFASDTICRLFPCYCILFLLPLKIFLPVNFHWLSLCLDARHDWLPLFGYQDCWLLFEDYCNFTFVSGLPPPPPSEDYIGKTQVAVAFVNKQTLDNGNPVRSVL